MLLGTQDGNSAQRTEGVSPLDSLRERLLASAATATGRGATAAMLNDNAVEAVATRVLKALKGSRQAERASLEEVIQKVADDLTQKSAVLEAELETMTGWRRPAYVSCSSKAGGLAHATTDADRACCSFKWREANATPVPASVWAELADNAKCKRWSAVVGRV